MAITPFKGKFEKLTWKEVRDDVVKVNPKFAKIIDELSPSNKYWIAKVTYPYGSLVLQRANLMLPNANGNIVPLNDPSINSEIREGLNYNLDSNPVSIVLRNTFEIFFPLEDRTIPLSGLIYPGCTFGAWRVLNPDQAQQPAFLWDMTAGARSVFMLPKITEAKKYIQLKKVYNLTADMPRSLMGHWEVFRQLASSPAFQNPWDAEILYFSKQWFQHLSDFKWKPFYYFFQDSAWGATELWRNQFIWNLIFSLILKNYETRPSAYIMDTTKYLLYASMGAFSAFAPAGNDLAGPFKEIQRIYSEVYDLRKYPPIIMQPDTYDMHDSKAYPIYYSLQFPNASEFRPSSRTRTSVITDLHEIRSLMIRYEQEILSDKFNISGTKLGDIFLNTNFEYFHNGVELHTGMLNSSEMPKGDKRLLTSVDGTIYDSFPDMCYFVKGCIRIAKKKN